MKHHPIYNYCHKKLNNIEYKISLVALGYIIGELAALCKIFQHISLILLDAFYFAHAKINIYSTKYLGEKNSLV